MPNPVRGLRPLKAIRQHCLECSGGSTKEVKECAMAECPLHHLRFGINPHKKGMGDIQRVEPGVPAAPEAIA